MRINKSIRIYLLSMMAVMIITAMTGCGSADTSRSGSGNLSVNKQSNDSASTIESSAKSDSNVVLSISSGCSGCGKCTMIDPGHFSRNSSGRIPLVISQDNLDSNDLQQAIRNCHSQAIILS